MGGGGQGDRCESGLTARKSDNRTMSSPASLLVAMLAGVFGMAYFMYGKKQAKLVPLTVGVLLCVYPYFVDSVLWSSIIGVVLVASPFVINHWWP